AVEVMWGAGDSNQAFTITGNHFLNVGSAVLNNLDPSQVVFYRSGSGLGDLTIENKTTDSTLTFSNEFVNSYQGVASVTFGDGTVWQASTIAANTHITAASGSYDTSGLSGTVIYDLGTGTFGNVSAFENQATQVIWGPGDSSQAFTITGNHFQNVGSLVLANLDPADVAFYRTGSGQADLTILNKATGNTLTFSNEFAASYEGIASVTFSDGTVWQASDISANLVAAPPPTLSNTPARAFFTEQSAAATLASALSVSDTGIPMLAGPTVSIPGGVFTGDGDVLAAATTGTNITASYNAATEALILSGGGTLANYQQVLDTVTFSSSGKNPTDY